MDGDGSMTSMPNVRTSAEETIRRPPAAPPKEMRYRYGGKKMNSKFRQRPIPSTVVGEVSERPLAEHLNISQL